MTAAAATYTLLDGKPMPITHHGRPITAALGEPVVVPIPPAPPALAQTDTAPGT